MDEKWLPVRGYDRYEVSSRGRVRSFRRGPVPHMLKQFKRGSGGYLAVNLMTYGGRWKQVYVHVLVLEAFHRLRPPGLQACHGPGGKYDNRFPENLRWGTGTENWLDKCRDGTALIGVQHPRAKLSPEIVRECKARRDAGATYSELAAEFDVTVQCIWQAVNRKNWQHVM